MEKILSNWVLVEINDSNKYIKLGEDKFVIDTTFEPERRAQVQGVVVDFGKIYFNPKDPDSNAYEVELEIKKGDTVLFHYLAVAGAIKDGQYEIKDGHQYIYIKYDQIFCAIRYHVSGTPDADLNSCSDMRIIPLNGWVFVKPRVETIKSDLIYIPESAQNEISKTRGTVEYLGSKVNRYLNYPTLSDDCIDVEVGDDILFSENEAVPLHDSLQLVLKGFYRLHRIDILGVYAV